MIWIPTRLADGATLPAYKTDGAAGMDLCAMLPRPRILWPLVPTRIPTGVSLATPENYEGHIVGRSGLGLKGVCVLGGQIDSDYRGAMSVIVVLLRIWPLVVRPGDRIAQIVFSPVARARLSTGLPMDSTARGARGFGSTGAQPMTDRILSILASVTHTDVPSFCAALNPHNEAAVAAQITAALDSLVAAGKVRRIGQNVRAA